MTNLDPCSPGPYISNPWPLYFRNIWTPMHACMPSTKKASQGLGSAYKWLTGLVSRVCMAGLVFRVCMHEGSKYHVTGSILFLRVRTWRLLYRVKGFKSWYLVYFLWSLIPRPLPIFREYLGTRLVSVRSLTKQLSYRVSKDLPSQNGRSSNVDCIPQTSIY